MNEEMKWRLYTGASSLYIRPELQRLVEAEEIRRYEKLYETPTLQVRNRFNIVSHIKTLVYVAVMSVVSKLF